MHPSISGIGSPLLQPNPVTKSDVDARPEFQVQHFVLKTLDDEPVGLFVGPVDSKSDCHFTLFAPYNPEAPTQPLNSTLLDPQDFNTQIAFDTLPVLEVWHYVTGGIILKFPD